MKTPTITIMDEAQSAIDVLFASSGNPKAGLDVCARCTPPRAHRAIRAYGTSQFRMHNTHAITATRHTAMIANSSLPLTYVMVISLVALTLDSTVIVYTCCHPFEPNAVHTLTIETTANQLMFVLKPVKQMTLTGHGISFLTKCSSNFKAPIAASIR